MAKRWIGLLVGAATGYLSAHSLFEQSYTAIFFWGAIGIVLGLFCRDGKETRWMGLMYGFFMMLAFLLFGFQGAADKFFGFLLFSLVLSFVSAFGGWLAAFIGFKVKSFKK